MNETKITLYTLPGCHKCVILKNYLKSQNVEFKEKSLNTEAQVELIMKNIYSDPPMLGVNGNFLTPDKMFGEEGLLDNVVQAFLSDSKRGVEV